MLWIRTTDLVVFVLAISASAISHRLHYLKNPAQKKLSVLQQMLAACFTANEDYPSAMAALETIPKDQKTAKIEQDYVTNMVRLGDPGGARERARRALKAFPEDPHLCFQDGLLSLELGLDSSGALNYKKRHVVFVVKLYQ